MFLFMVMIFEDWTLPQWYVSCYTMGVWRIPRNHKEMFHLKNSAWGSQVASNFKNLVMRGSSFGCLYRLYQAFNPWFGTHCFAFHYTALEKLLIAWFTGLKCKCPIPKHFKNTPFPLILLIIGVKGPPKNNVTFGGGGFAKHDPKKWCGVPKSGQN